MKPGQIVMLAQHLDKIDPKTAIKIHKNPIGLPGGPVTIAGVLSPKAYKVKTWTSAGKR